MTILNELDKEQSSIVADPEKEKIMAEFVKDMNEAGLIMRKSNEEFFKKLKQVVKDSE